MFKIQRQTGRASLLRWGLAAFCLGILPQAGATRVAPTPLETLALRADAIVHGRVTSVETTRDRVGRQFTRVELEVAEMWKGTATNRFELVMTGGVLGEHWVRVVGEPVYTPGEEVVVFTVANPAGEAVTLDLAQGKFAVTTDADTKLKWVSNGVWGGVLEGPVARPPQQKPLGLEALHERVRTAVAEGGRR